jgi:hypothetical protein
VSALITASDRSEPENKFVPSPAFAHFMKKYGVAVHKLEAVNLPFGGQINISFFID